ncbi:hypothetical protein [Streptomyces sp. NPDC048385]|uniref:hypothetical protein n=1 Tax=Streptomyces sp. NPDC048385 TaxID=3155145 RepID=UPI003442063B
MSAAAGRPFRGAGNCATSPHAPAGANGPQPHPRPRPAHTQPAAADGPSCARKALAEVRLDGYGGRRPAQLSGGQCQRVATSPSRTPHPAPRTPHPAPRTATSPQPSTVRRLPVKFSAVRQEGRRPLGPA